MTRPSTRTLLLGAVAVLVLLFQNPTPRDERAISYTQYLALEGGAQQVTVRGDEVDGWDGKGQRFTARVPSGAAVAARLAERGVEVVLAPARTETGAAEMLGALFTFGWPVVLLWFLHRIVRALERGPA